MFSKCVETAQKKIEGNNYDMRKSLLDYDNIVSEQRKIIYEKRNELLDTEDVHAICIETIKDFIYDVVMNHIEAEGYLTDDDLENICDHLNASIIKKDKIEISDLKNKKEDEVVEYLTNIVINDYEE